MTFQLARLPETSAAQLPQVYQAACTALAECARIDECQDWADRAAALASYAKQADDETLHKYADRIKARAIRRCGELLKQIPSAQGAANQHVELPVGTVTRQQAATDAGLSERQKVTALRVASIPQEDFDYAVESQDPPTVTALAAQGTQLRGKASVSQFRAATAALMTLREFSLFVQRTDPADVAAGVQGAEVATVRSQISAIDAWLDRFVVSLRG